MEFPCESHQPEKVVDSLVQKKVDFAEKPIKCSRFKEICSLNPDDRDKYFFKKYRDEAEEVSKNGPDESAPIFRLLCHADEIQEVTQEEYDSIKLNLPKIRFEKSAIHLWGVFSACKIQQNEPIVEYTGELIRTSVTEARQKSNEKEGNNGSYIFKLDDDLFIDATQKGGIARFLNHSCQPNCKTRIIVVRNGDIAEKHVVICAKRPIRPFEELTYDYRLPYEEKSKAIVCFCGSLNCKGYLNYSEEYERDVLLSAVNKTPDGYYVNED